MYDLRIRPSIPTWISKDAILVEGQQHIAMQIRKTRNTTQRRNGDHRVAEVEIKRREDLGRVGTEATLELLEEQIQTESYSMKYIRHFVLEIDQFRDQFSREINWNHQLTLEI